MIYQLPTNEILQIIADIIGAIMSFLQPIVRPIGLFMVSWIEQVLKVFPTELTLYVVIFLAFIISAVIVNSIWPGDKRPKYLQKKKTEDRVSKKDVLDDSPSIKEEDFKSEDEPSLDERGLEPDTEKSDIDHKLDDQEDLNMDFENADEYSDD